jgi:FkbM family methyltransferase
VNKCIGGANSKGVFNIAFTPTASSMLQPSPDAEFYTFFTKNGEVRIWGEHANIVKSVDININTLDSLNNKEKLPPVDFLSIDAQGAELDIINGASKMLKSSTIGIVCEVEFAELYSGQPLFCDIQDRLRKDDFRFCDIYRTQYHNNFPYSKELQGNGFFTVGEALFLKQPSFLSDNKKEVIRCIKLAAVAVAFDQLDYALKILRSLYERKLVSLDELAKNTQCNYIKLLRDLMKVADTVESDKPNSEPVSNKIGLFSKFFIARSRRILSRRLGNKNIGNYYSEVSKTFYKYGLYDLAEQHDTRYIRNLLSPLPGVMKYFFNVLS